MKKFLVLISSLLICLNCYTNVYAENSLKIVDEVDCLTDEQEEEINELISEYISMTDYDIVIYLTDDIGDYFEVYSEDDAITAIADDYYDYNGYGIGEDDDGLILCVVFGEETIGFNTFTVTTYGTSCVSTYTQYRLNIMAEEITEYLSEDDYAGAAKQFINEAAYTYNIQENYDPSDSNLSISSSTFVDALIPAIFPATFIGIIAALISFFIFKRQLKNTGISHTAGNYMSDRHIDILRSGEIYLYTTRTRHRIERYDDDDHHHHSMHSSPTHTSSSGRSHGGGGSHRF